MPVDGHGKGHCSLKEEWSLKRRLKAGLTWQTQYAGQGASFERHASGWGFPFLRNGVRSIHGNRLHWQYHLSA